MSTAAHSSPTQADAILRYLRTGASLTPLEALKMFSCFRLGARVWELNKLDCGIEKRMREVRTDDGHKARVAEYFIPKPGASTDARQPVPTE